MEYDNHDSGSADANPGDAGLIDLNPIDSGTVDTNPNSADSADASPVDADSSEGEAADAGLTDLNPTPTYPTPINIDDATPDDNFYRTVDGYQEPITQKLINNVQNANPERPQEVAGSQLELLARYRENVLKQARESFFWALSAAIAGIVLLFATIITYLVTRSLNVPIISGIGSIVVEVVSGLIFFLRTQSSKQLEAFSESLVKVNYYMLANSLCESLTDYQVRDATRIEIIRGIMFHATSYTQVQYTYGPVATQPATYVPPPSAEFYAPPPDALVSAPPTGPYAPPPPAEALAVPPANQ